MATNMDTQVLHDREESNGSTLEIGGLTTNKIQSDSGDSCSDSGAAGPGIGSASRGDQCFIDIKGDGDANCAIDEDSEKKNNSSEKVCRICHFGKTESPMELIQLGCDCRGELGSSHQQCAQAWFTQKGDSVCEICGKTVKIARGIYNNVEEASVFMEWNEMRMVAATLDTSRESSRRCKTFFNLLLACLLLAFLLPWFFRGVGIL